MKAISIVFIICLFLLNQELLTAQNNTVNPAAKKQTVPAKKSTVKDLNKLETEKIKAIVVNVNQKQDTIIRKDSTSTVIKSEEKVVTEIKNDSVKAVIQVPITPLEIQTLHPDTISIIKTTTIDSVVMKSESVTILNADSILITTQKIDSVIKSIIVDSTTYGRYSKNARLADSIKNMHKHWLDSTLSVLPTKKPVVLNKDDEIEIYISGGGLYTGVNPTIYNRLTIYNSGLVHKETKTKLQGEKVEDKKVSKDALKKLAQYIIDQGFFDYNYLYDCAPGDKACNARLNMDPEPSALSVTVTVGARRKKIYVALYAPHMESNWVNYPASLEKIVNAIYEVAEE